VTAWAITLAGMASKPNPWIGLFVGALAAWISTVLVSHAGTKLNVILMVRLDDRLSDSLPWALLVLGVAVAFGIILSLPVISAGALVGAGALLTGVGLAVQLLPIRQAFDLAKVFEMPGADRVGGYLVWDGSALFVGAILLVLGVRRWIADAKQTRPQTQGYQPGYPPQQQPGPWGDYPGRQAPGPQDGQPSGYPPQGPPSGYPPQGYPPQGQRPQGPPPGQPTWPPQGQPPTYPQQPGGTFPG